MAKVVYVEHGGAEHSVEVAPGDTLMHGAVWNSVPGMVAHCGGAGGCATCHVYVDQGWIDVAGPPSPRERRTLRFAFAPQANSRLACQIVMTQALDGIVVSMPARQF